MINPEIINIKSKLIFSIAYKTTVSYLKLAQKFLQLIQEDIPKISENHLILFESGFEIIKKINNFTTLDWVFHCLNFYLQFAYFCKKERNFNYAIQKITLFLSKINIDLIITNFNVSFSGVEKLYLLTAEFAKKCENLEQSLFYAKQCYIIVRNCIENKFFYKKFLDSHEKSEKILGEKNLFLGYVEKFVAELLILKNDQKEAISYFEKAYFRFEKEFGANAPLTEKIYAKIKGLKSKFEMENIIDGMNLKSTVSPSNNLKKAISTNFEERISSPNTNFSEYSKKNETAKIKSYYLNPKVNIKNFDSAKSQSQNKSTGLTINKSEKHSKMFLLSRYIGTSKNFVTNSKISLTDRQIKKNLNPQYALDEDSVTNRDFYSFKKSFIMSTRPKINVLFENEKKKKNIVENSVLKIKKSTKNDPKKMSKVSLFAKRDISRKNFYRENHNGPYLLNAGSFPLNEFESVHDIEQEENENQAVIKNKQLEDFQNINFPLTNFQKSKINLWKNRIHKNSNKLIFSRENYEVNCLIYQISYYLIYTSSHYNNLFRLDELIKFRKEDCAKKIQRFFRYWINYRKNGIVPILYRNGNLIMPDFEEFKDQTPEKNNSPLSPFHKIKGLRNELGFTILSTTEEKLEIYDFSLFFEEKSLKIRPINNIWELKLIEFSRREYNFFLKIALKSNKFYFPLVLVNTAENINEILILHKDVWGIITQILENYYIENQIESHFKEKKIKICKNVLIKNDKDIGVSTLKEEEENPFFNYVQRVVFILSQKIIVKSKAVGKVMILVDDENLLDQYKKYFDTRRKGIQILKEITIKIENNNGKLLANLKNIEIKQNIYDYDFNKAKGRVILDGPKRVTPEFLFEKTYSFEKTPTTNYNEFKFDMNLILFVLVRIQKLYFFLSLNMNEEILHLSFKRINDNYTCDQNYNMEEFFKKIKVKCTFEKEKLKNKKQFSFLQKVELRKSLSVNLNFINDEIGIIENVKKETKILHIGNVNKTQFNFISEKELSFKHKKIYIQENRTKIRLQIGSDLAKIDIYDPFRNKLLFCQTDAKSIDFSKALNGKINYIQNILLIEIKSQVGSKVFSRKTFVKNNPKQMLFQNICNSIITTPNLRELNTFFNIGEYFFPGRIGNLGRCYIKAEVLTLKSKYMHIVEVKPMVKLNFDLINSRKKFKFAFYLWEIVQLKESLDINNFQVSIRNTIISKLYATKTILYKGLRLRLRKNYKVNLANQKMFLEEDSGFLQIIYSKILKIENNFGILTVLKVKNIDFRLKLQIIKNGRIFLCNVNIHEYERIQQTFTDKRKDFNDANVWMDILQFFSIKIITKGKFCIYINDFKGIFQENLLFHVDEDYATEFTIRHKKEQSNDFLNPLTILKCSKNDIIYLKIDLLNSERKENRRLRILGILKYNGKNSNASTKILQHKLCSQIKTFGKIMISSFYLSKMYSEFPLKEFASPFKINSEYEFIAKRILIWRGILSSQPRQILSIFLNIKLKKIHIILMGFINVKIQHYFVSLLDICNEIPLLNHIEKIKKVEKRKILGERVFKLFKNALTMKAINLIY